jgi:hypothetical protein
MVGRATVELTWPACDRSISASIHEIDWREPSDRDLPSSFFVRTLEIRKVQCRSTSQAQATSPGEKSRTIPRGL